MALLGSTVDPRLFIQDYSGFVDAAKMQAQGVMGLGQSIGQGIEKHQEAKKERQKLDASRKSAITNIESAVKMGESFGIPLGSTLQPVLDKLNDPNTTPYEAAMIGQSASDQIGNVLKLGMLQAELQSQSQRSQFAAAADIRKAELEAEKEAGKFKVLDITTPDRGTVKARFYNNGRVTDIYGNPLPGSAGRAASIESAGLDADGLGPPPTDPDEGLALPQGEGEMPDSGVLPPKQGSDLWDSSGKVITPSIAPQVPTGAAAGIEAAIPPVGAPRPQAVAGIESALQASAPQAASPWANVPGYAPPKSQPSVKVVGGKEARKLGFDVPERGTYKITYGETGQASDIVSVDAQNPPVEIVTGKAAEALNLNPLGTYEITKDGDKITDINTITSPPTGEQIEKKKESEREVEKAARAKEIALKTIDEFVDPKTGKATEKLDSAVGYAEEAATFVAGLAPILGTQSGESRSNQQRLNRLVESGILDAASLLKPVSNTDLAVLIKNRPQITSPTVVWEQYFKELKKILGDPNNYIDSTDATGTTSNPTQTQPVDAGTRLRAKDKNKQ